MIEILYYIVGGLIILGTIYAVCVQARVEKTFNAYKNVEGSKGLTTGEACQKILSAAGVTDVQILSTPGKLTDHYNPKNKTVNLSEDVYNSKSISALGVAAHEVGHAIQHAQGYVPLKIRNFLVGVSGVCSRLFFPLLIVGVILAAWELIFPSMIVLGIAVGFYGLTFIIALVTYPVEKNASKRALDMLVKENILDETEVRGAQVTLIAASRTYLASVMLSLLYFLRFVLAIFASKR